MDCVCICHYSPLRQTHSYICMHKFQFCMFVAEVCLLCSVTCLELLEVTVIQLLLSFCLSPACASFHIQDDSVEIIKPVPMTTSIPSSYDITNSTHITSSSNRSTRLFGGAGSPHISSIPSDASAFAPTSSAQNPNPQALPTPTDGSPNYLPVVPRPSVYNTPISLYSNENACEVAMGQRRGLLESQGESSQLNG